MSAALAPPPPARIRIPTETAYLRANRVPTEIDIGTCVLLSPTGKTLRRYMSVEGVVTKVVRPYEPIGNLPMYRWPHTRPNATRYIVECRVNGEVRLEVRRATGLLVMAF